MALIGELLINLRGDVASLTAATAEAKTNLAGVKAAAEETASSFRTLGEAAGAMLAAISLREIISVAERTAAAGEEISHVAERVGVSVSAYETFSYAAKLAGIEQESFNTALSRFSRNVGVVSQITENSTGSIMSAASAFAGMGISIRDVNGDMLPMQDILTATLDKIGSLPDKALANAYAFATFGRSAQGLSTLAKELADGGFEQIRAKAQELGILLSDQTVEAAKKTSEEFKTLSSIVQNEMISALVAAAPQIAVVTNALIELSKDAAYIAEQFNKPLIDPNQLGIDMFAKQLALIQERDELLKDPGTAMQKYNVQVGELSDTLANLNDQIERGERELAELPGERSTGQDNTPKPGPPVVDPAVMRETANYQRSLTELLDSERAARDAQVSLGEAYREGSKAVDDARVASAGAAAVLKLETDALKDHRTAAMDDRMEVGLAAEYKERATLATEHQKAATDAMVQAAKAEYDSLLKLGSVHIDFTKTISDLTQEQQALANNVGGIGNLSKAQLELASSIGKVWEAYDLGIVGLKDAEAQIKELQTAVDATSKSSKEIIAGIERGGSSFLEAFSSLPGAIDKADQSEQRLHRTHQQLSTGDVIVQHLSQSFLGLVSDIEKVIAQALILEPLMASLGIENGKLTSTGPIPALISSFGGGAAKYFGLPAAAPAVDASAMNEAGFWDQFATGGSFDVGGSGGTDSQTVGFKATPGEHVAVSPPGTQNNNGDVNVQIINNHSGAQVSTQAAPDGRGGKSLIVQIDEAMAYGVSIGRSQTATALQQAGIAGPRTPVTR